jgi:hypothetical protein
MSEPNYALTQSAFSMLCRVEIHINAKAEAVWNLLTDAKNFPRWNSTVTSIEGEIRDGEQLRLRVPGTDRIFTPKVSVVVPGERMIWAGGFWPIFEGVRTFELGRRGDGSTDFTMAERFSGLMLPLAKRWFPDFRPVFEHYAGDLKREAEERKA